MADRDEKGLFQPGNKMGKGRPKGARNRLGEAFLDALANDFDEHGVAVIQQVRAEDPVAYVKVCASILPRELNVNVTDDLSDEQLDQRIRQLAAALDLSLESGIARAPVGETEETRH